MKYVVVIAFLLGVTIVHAQEISGIGVIKLGKTETQVISDLKIESKNIVDGAAKTMKELNKKNAKTCIKIKFDPTSKLVKDMLSRSINLDYSLENWGIEKCTDAEVLLIPKYEVAGVTIENLKLTFYKDTLIRILYKNRNDENKNFLVAFKAKYGEGNNWNSNGSGYSLTMNTWKSAVTGIVAESRDMFSYDVDPDPLEIAFGGSGSRHTYSFKIENYEYIMYLRDCNEKGATNKKNDEL